MNQYRAARETTTRYTRDEGRYIAAKNVSSREIPAMSPGIRRHSLLTVNMQMCKGEQVLDVTECEVAGRNHDTAYCTLVFGFGEENVRRAEHVADRTWHLQPVWGVSLFLPRTCPRKNSSHRDWNMTISSSSQYLVMSPEYIRFPLQPWRSGIPVATAIIAHVVYGARV